MNAHLADVQQRISCVQAASNHQALRACMPPRGERGGERHEGPGSANGGPGPGDAGPSGEK
jgi:hypothetical protein